MYICIYTVPHLLRVVATLDIMLFVLFSSHFYPYPLELEVYKLTLKDLLLRYAQTRGPSGSGDYFAASCSWATANRQLWETWIPKKTTCSSGKGLVDLQQNFVVSKSDAVECGTCTPGRASVKSGDTRICSKCVGGSYQNLDCKTSTGFPRTHPVAGFDKCLFESSQGSAL